MWQWAEYSRLPPQCRYCSLAPTGPTIEGPLPYTYHQIISHCPAEGTEWPYSFALRIRHGRRNGTRVRASALAKTSTVEDPDPRVPATRTPLISSSWWKYDDDGGDTACLPSTLEPSFPLAPEAAWRWVLGFENVGLCGGQGQWRRK